MPICFYVEGADRPIAGPLLPEPLFVYLLELRPHIRSNISWLGDLDYWADSRFDAESGAALTLASAVRRLERELATADWTRLPPLPELGDEQLADSPPLTKKSVVGFLSSLADCAELADQTGGTLVGYGD